MMQSCVFISKWSTGTLETRLTYYSMGDEYKLLLYWANSVQRSILNIIMHRTLVSLLSCQYGVAVVSEYQSR